MQFAPYDFPEKCYNIQRLLYCLQAFQKGSPIAADFSKAILRLSEDGNITLLEKKLFSPSSECNAANTKIESLSLHSFWGIYAISGATSTLCFLLFFFRLLKNFRHKQEELEGNNVTPSPRRYGTWNKAVGLAKYFYKGEVDIPTSSRSSNSSPTSFGSTSISSRGQNLERRRSSKWEYVRRHSDNLDDLHASTPAGKIEML